MQFFEVEVLDPFSGSGSVERFAQICVRFQQLLHNSVANLVQVSAQTQHIVFLGS